MRIRSCPPGRGLCGREEGLARPALLLYLADSHPRPRLATTGVLEDSNSQQPTRAITRACCFGFDAAPQARRCQPRKVGRRIREVKEEGRAHASPEPRARRSPARGTGADSPTRLPRPAQLNRSERRLRAASRRSFLYVRSQLGMSTPPAPPHASAAGRSPCLRGAHRRRRIVCRSSDRSAPSAPSRCRPAPPPCSPAR